MSRRPPARSGNGSRNRLSTAVTVPSDQLMRGDGHRQSVSAIGVKHAHKPVSR